MHCIAAFSGRLCHFYATWMERHTRFSKINNERAQQLEAEWNREGETCRFKNGDRGRSIIGKAERAAARHRYFGYFAHWQDENENPINILLPIRTVLESRSRWINGNETGGVMFFPCHFVHPFESEPSLPCQNGGSPEEEHGDRSRKLFYKRSMLIWCRVLIIFFSISIFIIDKWNYNISQKWFFKISDNEDSIWLYFYYFT